MQERRSGKEKYTISLNIYLAKFRGANYATICRKLT